MGTHSSVLIVSLSVTSTQKIMEAASALIIILGTLSNCFAEIAKSSLEGSGGSPIHNIFQTLGSDDEDSPDEYSGSGNILEQNISKDSGTDMYDNIYDTLVMDNELELRDDVERKAKIPSISSEPSSQSSKKPELGSRVTREWSIVGAEGETSRGSQRRIFLHVMPFICILLY